VEVVLVAGLILATIWLAPLYPDRDVAKRIGYGLAISAFGIAIASNFAHRDSWVGIGVRVDNFLRAFGWVLIPTVVLVLVLLAIGYGFDCFHFGRKAFALRPRRILWPLIQQYLLNGFLNRRLQDVVGKGKWSVLGAAAIFALIHAPNPALMVATFLTGAIWAKIFQREPNLFAVTLSHAILAVLLKGCLPVEILPNMRVGWSFWRE